MVEPFLDVIVSKVILCVRNPLDVLVSYFNFSYTWTHSKQIKQEYHIDFKEIWESDVKFLFKIWVLFHKWYLNLA